MMQSSNQNSTPDDRETPETGDGDNPNANDEKDIHKDTPVTADEDPIIDTTTRRN